MSTTCPGLSKRNDAGVGYKTLSDTIDGYRALGTLPAGINFALWDEGDGIENTLTLAGKPVKRALSIEEHLPLYSDIISDFKDFPISLSPFISYSPFPPPPLISCGPFPFPLPH